jgi:hypothetical protein
MKITQSARFAHPVLTADTDDYAAGKQFSVQTTFTEQKSGAVIIRYSIDLNEEAITALIVAGDAEAGLFITCKDTYYSRLHPLALKGGKLDLKSGNLKGMVSIRPMIYARKAIGNYTSDTLHDEFRSDAVSFSQGAILALDDEYTTYVGREKLAPMESIFSFGKKEGMREGEFEVDLNKDKITILASQTTFEAVNKMRGMVTHKPFLLNGVYLPVVMDVLAALKDGGAEYEECQWYRIFMAKCDFYKIDPAKNCEILKSAQMLLQNPFLRIQNSKALQEES